MNLHVCVCRHVLSSHTLVFAAAEIQTWTDTKYGFCVLPAGLCSFLFFPEMQPQMAMQRGDRRESNRREEGERERGDTGERENQPALTLRQSISSLLSLFPVGWPG